MPTIVRAAFDYKYGNLDWRLHEIESFQQDQEIKTRYVVVDGEITRIIEETLEFSDPLAGVALDPIAGPPYLFADQTNRRDPAYTMLLTHRITTSYDALSTDTYRITTDTHNVETNAFERVVQILPGKRPGSPTKQSALTGLKQEPIVATLIDADAFTPKKESFALDWAQDDFDMFRSTKRRMQRNTAVKRWFTCAYNPLHRRGQTARIVDPKRGIDALHLIVGRQIKISSETGEAQSRLAFEWWPRR